MDNIKTSQYYIQKIIEDYLFDKQLVVFIKDTHKDVSTEFKRFGGVSHCLENTSESELVDELKKYEGKDNTISIEKNSTSYMEAAKFRKLIKDLSNIKQVDVVGCCTDICVFNGTMGLSNYFDENNKDVEIKVYEDAVETYSKDSRQNYIEAAKLLMEQQGIQLIKKYERGINYGK